MIQLNFNKSFVIKLYSQFYQMCNSKKKTLLQILFQKWCVFYTVRLQMAVILRGIMFFFYFLDQL